MRLLNTGSFELESVSDIQKRHNEDPFGPPRYAILSHRWIEEDEGGEIVFTNRDALKAAESTGVQIRDFVAFASFRKIKGACKTARDLGYEWIWTDTICIDKSNSGELGLALNSMFQWYKGADVCFALLQDVVKSAPAPGPTMFRKDDPNASHLDSEWFERGWTLQELLAPAPDRMMFYDKYWNEMGTKRDLANHLEKPTRIHSNFLNGKLRFQDASIATKMSWMAGRTTGVVADIAYSLLGIFDVEMTPIPNEGVKAFARLQETIMAGNSFDESLFAWETPSSGELACYRRVRTRKGQNGQMQTFTKTWHWTPTNKFWGLLAPSPDCFRGASGDTIVVHENRVTQRLRGGFQRTNQGVYLALPYKDTKTVMGTDRKDLSLPLNCWRSSDGTNVVLQLSRASKTDSAWRREKCDKLGSLKNAKIGDNRSLGIDQMITGAVTVHQPMLPSEAPSA